MSKRLFDFVAAVFCILAFAPLLLILAVLIRIKLGRPVLFRQRRPGKAGKLFVNYKYRSMSDEREQDGNLIADDQRLTDLGRFLRTTSLDELPELFNVFKGDMSLVGPRPLLTEYLPLYTPMQARRHEVRPGITGWAQVNGRNALSWEEKFRLDVWYVDNRSFLLDMKILLLTIGKVFRREGIGQGGMATIGRFTGSGGTK